MEDLARADEERFVTGMMERARERIREVIGAVNAARTGHLIDDSEGPVLQSLREFDRELYQAAIQARVDATESASSFSPSGVVGSGDGRSGASQPFGVDASGSCGVDPPAVLEQRRRVGDPRGYVGGSRGGDGERGGA